MNPNAIFIADDRLRPIWRFFLSAALLYAAVVLSATLAGTVLAAGRAHAGLWVMAFWQTLAGLVAIIVTSKAMTAAFESRPLGSMGLAFHPRWWRELGYGAVVGSTMLFVALLPEWGSGLARFAFAPHPTLGAGSFTFVLFALAAANEEALFRGYPFQRLAESISPAGAIAVTSAFFGIAHFANPYRTWISTLNTALVGVPFCIAYLRTRSLWMPIGMHWSWNYLMGFVLGLPVSGLAVPVSILTVRVRGPIWLTGGPYGPEGGLLAMGAILISTVYLLLTKRIYTSEEMKALISAPAAPWPDRPITLFPAPPEE